MSGNPTTTGTANIRRRAETPPRRELQTSTPGQHRRLDGIALRVMPAGLPLLVCWLGLGSSALAQAGPTGASAFGIVLKAMLLWLLVGIVLYYTALIIAGRLVGLPVGLGQGCLTMLLGGFLVAVLSFVTTLLVGDSLSPNMLTFLSQMIWLAAMWVAVKVCFSTSFPKALLSLLLASVMAFGVGAVALLIVY